MIPAGALTLPTRLAPLLEMTGATAIAGVGTPTGRLGAALGLAVALCAATVGALPAQAARASATSATGMWLARRRMGVIYPNAKGAPAGAPGKDA